LEFYPFNPIRAPGPSAPGVAPLTLAIAQPLCKLILETTIYSFAMSWLLLSEHWKPGEPITFQLLTLKVVEIIKTVDYMLLQAVDHVLRLLIWCPT
jgi:hypothetical protein